MASIFAIRYRKAIASTKIGVRASTAEADSNTSTITSGEGAPTTIEPNGSLYLRKDASTAADVAYLRVGGAWLALDGR